MRGWGGDVRGPVGEFFEDEIATMDGSEEVVDGLRLARE
jgi:hypothetical protein